MHPLHLLTAILLPLFPTTVLCQSPLPGLETTGTNSLRLVGTDYQYSYSYQDLNSPCHFSTNAALVDAYLDSTKTITAQVQAGVRAGRDLFAQSYVGVPMLLSISVNVDLSKNLIPSVIWMLEQSVMQPERRLPQCRDYHIGFFFRSSTSAPWRELGKLWVNFDTAFVRELPQLSVGAPALPQPTGNVAPQQASGNIASSSDGGDVASGGSVVDSQSAAAAAQQGDDSDGGQRAGQPEICPVCMDNMIPERADCCLLTCGHEYHRTCLRGWTSGGNENNRKCPMW